jgi:hypothetical protein
MGFFFISRQEKKNEFIPSVSGAYIWQANIFLAYLGDLHKCLIAYQMPVRVIDNFEIINVKKSHGKNTVISLCYCLLMPCKVNKISSIVYTSKLVCY